MDINKMSRKQFLELPHRKWDEVIECDSLIILPMPTRHDSGYRNMYFVAVSGDKAVLIGGGSDVIHIDGIGGYGINWVKKYGGVPKFIPPSGWSIDCLPVSGLLRMWPSSQRIHCGTALSSFEIYALPPKDKT